MKRFTIWIDHQRAYILEFTAGGIKEEKINSVHEGKPTKDQLKKYYHKLAQTLEGAEKILILGPGIAKEEFKNHCEQHHPSVNKAIIKIATMKDHPTQKEIMKASHDFYQSHTL